MTKHRLHIRFRKEGDLRLIGHRDLARTFERLLRRIELPLAMSEGFHPHPKINFPSALAVGVEGLCESVEITLSEPVNVSEIEERLSDQLPEGLIIIDVRSMDDREPKMHVEEVDYSVPISNDDTESVRAKIVDFLAADSWLVERTNRHGTKQVDIRPGVHALELNDNHLTMRLETTQSFNVRPREVLSLLGIEDLETQGKWLTRTRVHLAS